MSILDKVVNNVKSVEPGVDIGLTSQVIDFLKTPEIGGIQGLTQKFEAAGLGPTIKSWIGGAKPLPITPDDVTRVFGNEVIAKFANKTGLPVGDLVQKLTTILPETISKLTPAVNVPSSSAIGELGSKITEKTGI